MYKLWLIQYGLQNRQYFDSGDFALSEANNASDVGAVKTGKAHPLRENLSHPLAPVPSNSNVSNDANHELGQTKSLTCVREVSRNCKKLAAEEETNVQNSLKTLEEW